MSAIFLPRIFVGSLLLLVPLSFVWFLLGYDYVLDFIYPLVHFVAFNTKFDESIVAEVLAVLFYIVSGTLIGWIVDRMKKT